MTLSLTPAGLSMTTSKTEDFYLTYFEIQNHEGVRFKLHIKDQSDFAQPQHDLLIVKFLKDSKVKSAIVDFPLSQSLCFSCKLQCPGSELCPKESIVHVRGLMNALIDEDNRIYKQNPKKYEVERRSDELFELEVDLLAKRTDEHLLSKAFKRRLKKGLSPYANRPLDFWVWQHYYDAYLSVFQTSFDSFGDFSFMQFAYFDYWKRHLPKDFSLHETASQLVLLELHRAEMVEKKQLIALVDINQAPLARLEIVRALTHQLHLIITESQYDKLVRNPRAFSSFILAVAGTKLQSKNVYSLPDFADVSSSHFFVPYFLNKS